METELPIEVMSFGPMIEVLGNDGFLAQLKARLRWQQRMDKAQQESKEKANFH